MRVRAVEGRMVSELNALKAGIANRYIGYIKNPSGGYYYTYDEVEVPDNSYYRKCLRDGDLELLPDY